MTTKTHEDRHDAARPAMLGAALALALGTLVLGASPADARNDFRNGFEDEMGRIVAHHVAAVGHAILAGPVVIHKEVHIRHGRPYRHRVHRHPHARPHRHKIHRHRAHRRDCGHRGHVRGRGHRHDHGRIAAIGKRVHRESERRGGRGGGRGRRARYDY